MIYLTYYQLRASRVTMCTGFFTVLFTSWFACLFTLLFDHYVFVLLYFKPFLFWCNYCSILHHTFYYFLGCL